ncbi:hypothetical protein ACJ41O_006717 [Fusarium nematophilum]
MIPLIALEEHFLSNELLNSGLYPGDKLAKNNPTVHKTLSAVDESRLENMNRNSISIQVLSHIPVNPPLHAVQQTNDLLHSYTHKFPDRFKGFALLSMNDPVEAAHELERSVKELGFVGALVGAHLDDGGYYDGSPYDVFWAKAQELGVPIYLHPHYPSDQEVALNYSDMDNNVVAMHFACWCWGWHAKVGLCILRMFANNVFERFPTLKIIIGHMGEMIPFMLRRIVDYSKTWPNDQARTRGLREVWDSNIWVTTSGFFALGPMACLLQETKIDRIMYSVDYPLAKNEDGLKFMQELEASGLVDREGFEKIAYKNAENLLGIKVKQ